MQPLVAVHYFFLHVSSSSFVHLPFISTSAMCSSSVALTLVKKSRAFMVIPPARMSPSNVILFPFQPAELWLIWGLEALAVLTVAAAIAYTILEAQPFCEKCGLWCSSTEKLLLSAGDPGHTRQSLAKRDLSFLEKLGPGNQKISHMTAQLHSCANCGELNTLTLQQATIVQTSKWRKPTITNVNLAIKLLLSRQEADAFRNTAHNMKQLAKAAHA